jgi:penicillin amidase
MKKALQILVGLLLIAGVLFVKNYLKPTEILYSGTIETPNITKPVEVYFDSYGVPHVFAENDDDMFFVAGYLGARDRLFQMAFMKYTYTGQLSRVVNDTLFAEDKFLRTLGFESVAEKTLEKIPKELLAHLQKTCDGINAYAQSLSPAEYPLEFRLIGIEELPTFEPKDIAGLSTLMAWELQGGWDSELFFGAIQEQFGPEYLADILPGYKPNYITIASSENVLLLGYQEFAEKTRSLRNVLKTERSGYGSNVWVVSGKKTLTKKPLLANDPHLAFNQPPWWYEIRLKSNNYNFGGYGLYGFPLPVLGHNEHIAWGFTNVMADDMDFYVEKLNEDLTEYYMDGEWIPLTIKKETTKLRSGKEKEIIIKSTHRGPIVSGIHPDSKNNNRAISFRWTEFDAFDETTAMFRMAKAKNWEEFSDASKTFGAPGQNLTYADTQGNIGWRPGVKIPIREGAEALLPFDGTTSKHDWQGYVPFEEMPFLFNPEKGYISNGNNKTIDSSYPYYISRYWADPSRATQIQKRLEELETVNIKDMADIQNDITSPFAQEYLKVFTKIYRKKSSVDGDRIYALLKDWDGKETIESQAALAFHLLYLATVENLFEDELRLLGKGSMETLLSLRYIKSLAVRKAFEEKKSLWIDNIDTPKQETLEDIVNQSFKQAGEKLTSFKDKTWGNVHTLTVEHRLDKDPVVKKWINFSVGPFPMAGSDKTPRAASYKAREPFEVVAGASMRRIIDLSNLDNGLSILPTGQSGLFGSKHYDDQAPLYNSNSYKPFQFHEETIKNDPSMKKLIFLPASR